MGLLNITMGFIKVLKNKSYSSRYQTKFRRRREGKTDYYARKRLVFQEKDKYDSRKYRFCVRRTCSKIITQVIHATLVGDRVIASAQSDELKRYGLKGGLTNYPAAYCTGLLCARRLLADKGLADMYKGNNKVDGSYYSVGDNMEDRRPFKAHLDVGLIRTTVGNRVFGAMKGASDGGLNIPHKDKCFPGFHVIKAEIVTNKRGKATEVEKAKSIFDPKEHRKHIFGEHVQSYYDQLKGENEQKFKKQFGKWEKFLEGKKFEELYKKVHAGIRASPQRVKKEPVAQKARQTKQHVGYVIQKGKGKEYIRHVKLTYQQRKDRVAKKMAAMTQALAEAAQ